MRRVGKVAIGRSAGASACTFVLAGALVVVLPGVFSGSAAPVASANRVAPACGGVAPNPSVEQTTEAGGAPQGYLFTPAAPVPRSTPPDKVPKLVTDSAHATDGKLNAQIQTPDGRVSSASQTLPAAPGSVFTLSAYTGSVGSALSERGNAQSAGLRFTDATGRTLLEKAQDVTHDVTSDGKLARQDFPAQTAPEKTANVTFFASTNHNWVLWDCVDLQEAAYTVKEEVQNPITGEWGASATIPAGETAHYRTTVTNSGTAPLTGVLVKDSWCTGLPGAFDLAPGASRQLPCDHPNLAENDTGHVNKVTVTGVKAPSGPLTDQTATASITVTPLPLIDKVGDRAWRDDNRNGLQDDGEPGVPDIPVTLKDGAGSTLAATKTGADGTYAFDKRKDGTYQVCFDVSHLPDGLTVTKAAAGDPAKDSDADTTTGCTAAFTLGGDHRENLDEDLGLAPPPPPPPAPAPSSTTPPPPPTP
ncbi:SdrD B-like domain-containing protein [Amycolatopsis sp. FDAARGOS 1241]|uniref:DUF7850 domain-containing protein n=1 Tax=Amycolatopsis sp. FDAARGOS 1241 TaxID=2778070 RepID=UPI00195212A9|nr:SdrD B-like domain-containing protein [Amycolatopsis sp. FDAARGOS 1241]QRP46130.1 hypothetical protein I6J71_45035 [Amycolatopsis sp. FDAARGOS 1241]